MTQQQSNWFCADVSAAAGEPLIGTASRTDVWLMLEYAGPWENKALDASTLPQAVKDHLKSAEKSIPFTRVELIKREKSPTSGDFTFFVALSSDRDPRLYRFTLPAYEDILPIDLAAVARAD